MPSIGALLLTRVGRGQTMRTMMDTTKQAFTVREFCARYGICRATFYGEVKHGRLRALKLGKKTIVMRADADAWAASLPALKIRASA